MRTFFDLAEGEKLSLQLGREVLFVEELAARTGRRAASTDLLAAEALVLVVRRFLLQDDLTGAGVRIGAYGVELGTDLAQLQLAIAEFAVAMGLEGIANIAVAIKDDIVVAAKDVKTLVTTIAKLLEEPPRVNATKSDADIVREDVGELHVQAEFGVGVSGKVEVHRQVLADGTVRVIVTGEAGALIALGIGVKNEGAEAGISGEAGGGGFVTVTFDCPSQADANRLLARMAVQAGVDVVAGGTLPLTAPFIAKWAAGAKYLRLPQPTEIELGVYNSAEVHGGLSAPGVLGVSTTAGIRVQASVSQGQDGSRSEKVEVSGSYHGSLEVNGQKFDGEIGVSGGLQHDDKGNVTTAEFHLSIEGARGVGIDVAHAEEKLRTDFVFKLSYHQLNTAEGQQLVAAVKRGDMHAVQHMLGKIAGGSARAEVWAGIGGGVEVDNVESDVISMGEKAGASYTHWEHIGTKSVKLGLQG